MLTYITDLYRYNQERLVLTVWVNIFLRLCMLQNDVALSLELYFPYLHLPTRHAYEHDHASSEIKYFSNSSQ